MKKLPPSTPSFLRAFIAVAIVVVSVALWKAGPTSPAASQTPAAAVAPMEVPVAASPAKPDAPSPPPVETPVADRAAKFEWFRQRPLAVAQETGRNQWTADDARRPEVIEKIAHNDLEVERMTKENPAIYRRQLVYRKDTAAATVERARATGEPVQKLTLPGLDGQEFEMEVAHADIAPSGLSGTFAGHLPGRAGSVVTLAYKLDREAFTIVSPEDGVFLTAEAREPREVVVKRINPKLYAYFKCTTGVPAGTPPANCCGDQ